MGLYQGDKLLSSGGKAPVAYAKDAGYTGTDTDFYNALADMPDHISDLENPHGTTASQVGAYTKEETYNKEEVYNKTETNELLTKKADLDENGKVPSTQLPAMNYAPSTHASQHSSSGSDPITPASIGASPSGHTHDDRYYTETEVNNLLGGKQDASSAINTGNIGS